MESDFGFPQSLPTGRITEYSTPLTTFVQTTIVRMEGSPVMTQPRSLGEEIGKLQPFEAPEQEAYLSLMRTASVLAADFSRVFRQFGLSEATYNTLRILRGAGERGRTCGEVRDMLVAQVPDVTRLIDRLEESGFVQRERGQSDRRVVRIRITEQGLSLLARMDATVLDMHRAQLGHLSRDELSTLIQLLFRSRHPESNPADPARSTATA